MPAPHFDDPYSTVLLDKDGNLLSAQVAADEQWRFEEGVVLPEKYVTSLLNYEDRYYYYHPGINPVSIAKALVQDVRAGKIISGGSTITMQLARLSGKNPPRTILAKSWEMLKAIKAEIIYSKKTILKKYAAHAPFGSNVVGLEAACWRFFGTDPDQLSWAQAATLAVLPNSPALIFPGKNQEKLITKRNSLLLLLKNRKIIDEQTYSWIEQDLSYVPKGSLVFIAMHIPARLTEEQKPFGFNQESMRQQTVNIEPLFKMLEPFKAHIFTGHEHYNKNIIHSPRLYEHNTAAISGSFWQGDYCWDGTPIGYGVYEITGDDVKWYFKSAGHSREHQMRATAVGSSSEYPNDIIVNIWNWDKNWTVTWTENGEKRGEMIQFTGLDPATGEAFADKDKLEFKWLSPVPTDHLFRATPKSKKSKIEIIATDSFGEVFKTKL